MTDCSTPALPHQATRAHWMNPGENPPEGRTLCFGTSSAKVHNPLEGLPSKVPAAEYQTVLPDEKLLTEELNRTRRELEARQIARCGDGEDKE